MSPYTPSRHHETRSFYIRLVLGVVMALLGIASLFAAPNPETFSRHEANRTVLLATAHNNNDTTSTIVELRYLPAGMRESGANAIFIATLIAVAMGGGYTGSVIPRVEAEIKNTSQNKDEYDTRISNVWARGELDHLAGPVDRCLCLLYMMVASIGIVVASAISFIDDLKSPKIKAAEHPDGFLGSMVNSTNNTVILGSDKTDGTYNFAAWVCQWEPLLIDNPGHAEFQAACRRMTVSRYLLMLVLVVTGVQMIAATQPRLTATLADYIAKLFDSSWWKSPGMEWIALGSGQDEESTIAEEGEEE